MTSDDGPSTGGRDDEDCCRRFVGILQDPRSSQKEVDRTLTDLYNYVIVNLINSIRGIFLPDADAMFVANEAVYSAFKAIRNGKFTYTNTGQFWSWLYKITKYRALTEWRSLHRATVESLDQRYDQHGIEEAFEEEGYSEVEVETLQKLIEGANLSARERKVLEAFAIDGYKPAKIAEELEIQEDRVYRVLYDARKKVAAYVVQVA